ncbi:MAG: phosphotransferase [Nakamurella sp.]
MTVRVAARVTDLMDPAAVVGAASDLLGRQLRLERVLAGGQHARRPSSPPTVRTCSSSGASRPSYTAVAREVAVLPRLAPLGDLAPQLVAHGGDPAHPIILTTLLRGAAPAADLSPDRIARQMAVALARIRALPGAGPPVNPTASRRGRPTPPEPMRNAGEHDTSSSAPACRRLGREPPRDQRT